MPYYFMRDTPLQALEQLMMSQPGQKPRGGGIYRSPFRYTPEDVACEYERLRGRAIRDMKRTNGRISFKDAMDFQKSV